MTQQKSGVRFRAAPLPDRFEPEAPHVLKLSTGQDKILGVCRNHTSAERL